MAKRHALILLAYLVIALVMTMPLLFQFGDHVPGTTTWSMDEYGYVWNNWWFKHAVFDLGADPFETDFIFYPVGTGLVLYTYTLLHVLLGLPIQFLFGLIPASNSELIFGVVISGYGTMLLAYNLLGDWWEGGLDPRLRRTAAFVAGVVFAFSSNRFVYASLGHYNVIATEWIPFYILFLIKTVREGKWSNAGMAGLFLALAMYVEATDGVLLFLFTALYLVSQWREVLNWETIKRLGLMSATAGLAFAPLLIPTVNEILSSGYALPGWGHAEKLLVDLMGIFTPTSLHPLNRHWTEELDLVRQGISQFIDINTVFYGFVTVGLALVAVGRFGRRVGLWVASAVLFTLFSLGPLLHINGQSVFDLDGLQVTFPLPFLLLHYIPFLKENRVPNRFSILVMESLAVLVGFAVLWLIARFRDRLPSRWDKERSVQLAAAGIIVLLLFEHLAVPLPLTDARIPDVYAQIAKEPGPFAILTLPLGWRNSFGQQGAEDTRLQYYQSVHGKYVFQGNIQRNPPFLFEYFDRIPVFHSLTELEFYRPVENEALQRDRSTVGGLAAFFDIRYVVIQPAIANRPPYSDTHDAVAEYVRKVFPLGEQVYNRDGVLAYRLNPTHLPARLQADFGTLSANMFRAEGWDRDEVIGDAPANWANSQQARILLPVREVADYGLMLRALPFVYPGSPQQTVQVLVNGQPVQEFRLKPGWDNYTTMVQARFLHQGMNNVVLKFGYAVRPYDVLAPNYRIGQTGVISPVDVVVSGGAFGSIQVSGKQVSLLGRGYNIAAINAQSGKVESVKVFDTGNDKAQARAMADYMNALPNGTIVAVSTQEEVAGNLADRAVAALSSIGAVTDLRKTPSQSQAVIGVKGAAAGQALEQANEGNTFISVGHSPDMRTLAVAVSTVVFERQP